MIPQLTKAAVAAVALVGCSAPGSVGGERQAALPPAAAAPSTPAPPVPVRPLSGPDREQPDAPSQGAASLRFPGGDRHDEILQRLLAAPTRSFRPVGSTSTVFRVSLAGPDNAAFKAVTPDRPLGPTAEVSAYRIARCLGLANIAPAVSRRIPLEQIERQLVDEARPAWAAVRDRIVVEDDGTVLGAAIHWIPDLSDIGVDGARGMARWAPWLRLDGALPLEHGSLGASLSTMVAFDYLIGNFDRWSGGNARGSEDRQQVYLRDHDLAFPAVMGSALHRRLWQRVVRVERYTAAFYASLKALSRGCIELELARDPEGARGALLKQSQIDGVLDRRQAILSHIESLIVLHGRERVLSLE